MDRNLALEFVRVTEAAAMAAVKWVGRGDKHAADQAAVDAMRDRFKYVPFRGEVVIGEGKKDEAPELFVGEKLGDGQGPEIDIAVDPLECTDSVANGVPNALTVIATGEKGSLFKAPDMYMEKIAVGPKARGVVSLNKSVAENVTAVAKALGKDISDVVVLMLDRPRHDELKKQVRAVGARVRLISDGDVAGAIAPSLPKSGIDMLYNTGASAEAVLAAAAIKCLGGELQVRLAPKDENQKQELAAMGLTDIGKIFTHDDLAKGENLTFTATGVIDGPLLRGIYLENDYLVTSSVVMRASTGTVRWLTTHHRLK
jgi:fructose-1,6-bisphosphatase II